MMGRPKIGEKRLGKNITFRMDEKFCKELDNFLQEKNMKRSEFLRVTLSEKIKKQV